MRMAISMTVEAMTNLNPLKASGSMSSSEYLITVKFDPQMMVIKSSSRSVVPNLFSCCCSGVWFL
jgi:hypothetical protein